ncbi:MAG: hypothetical protein ABEJ43_10640 [Haloferacaceae archaeon]
MGGEPRRGLPHGGRLRLVRGLLAEPSLDRAHEAMADVTSDLRAAFG